VHKTPEIEDITLLRIGKIYEKQGDFAQALASYQEILDKYPESIYLDEALYFAADIYNVRLKDVEKAKSYYEKVIFSHQDSIYFIDARKKYRQLRGDSNI
jgi:tetratricopeptide (TPR) repeat protein